MHPGRSLPEIAEGAAGRLGGRAYLFLLGCYLLFWGPIGNQVTLLKMIQGSLLPYTSPTPIVGLMIGAAALAVYFGPEVIARVGEAWAFLLIPALFVLTGLAFLHAEPGRLLPLLPAPVDWASADLWSFALGLRGFFLALALAGMLRQERLLPRTVLGASLTAGVFVSLLVIAPHTVFVPAVLRTLHFPALETLDTVNASSVGVESLLALTLTVWTVISWLVVAAALFGASYLLSRAFGLRSHRPAILPLAVLATGIASWAIPTPTETVLMHGWSGLGYVVGILGPWLLAGLGAARGLYAGRRGS